MARGDVLSLEDLQTAKKHQIFEAEVITGKAGGVAGGATIGTATNPVTGQTQQTLPSILADLGFDVQPWTSSTGGVLASANQVFLNDTPGSLWLGDYYAWVGTFPKTVPAGTDPALPTSGYIMRSSRFASTQAREALRRSYAEAGYNLVDGSFEAGGTVTTATDVLLYEATGVVYAYSVTLPHTVGAGGTPIGNPLWVAKDATNLRLDISIGGSFAINGAVTAAASNLQSITPSDGLRLLCLGHSAVRDGGEGIFQYDSSLPKTMHDGGRFISPTVPAQALAGFILGTGETVPAGNGVWVRVGVTGKPHRLREYGISGSDDDSAAMSAFMQKLAGKQWLIDSTPAVFNVGMTGAAYNGTEIRFAPGCAIKNKSIVLADAGLFGTRAAFYIKDVDGVSGDWYGDGNRLGQPDKENCHNLAIYGGGNIDFGTATFTELRGDGLYLTQSDATASSTIPKNINIGEFYAYNSADDGRNGLSVISVDGLTIGKFKSVGVGGVVGGVMQPGGLDFEPNQEYQTINNVKIGDIYVETAGSNGLLLLGKGTSAVGGNITDVDLGIYRVKTKNNTQSTAVGVVHAMHVRGKGSATYTGTTFTGVAHAGLLVDAVSYADLNHVSHQYANGAAVGTKNRVVDSTIKVVARDYGGAGATLGNTAGCDIDVVALRSYSAAAKPVLFLTEYATKQATNTSYRFIIPKSRTATTQGVRNEPTLAMTFTGCVVTGDISGYDTFDNAMFGCGAGLRRNGVLGINWASSIPTNGTWARGDIVYNEAPAVPVDTVTLGWMRASNGNSNVAITDWLPLLVKVV